MWLCQSLCYTLLVLSLKTGTHTDYRRGRYYRNRQQGSHCKHMYSAWRHEKKKKTLDWHYVNDCNNKLSSCLSSILEKCKFINCSFLLSQEAYHFMLSFRLPVRQQQKESTISNANETSYADIGTQCIFHPEHLWLQALAAQCQANHKQSPRQTQLTHSGWW